MLRKIQQKAPQFQPVDEIRGFSFIRKQSGYESSLEVQLEHLNFAVPSFFLMHCVWFFNYSVYSFYSNQLCFRLRNVSYPFVYMFFPLFFLFGLASSAVSFLVLIVIMFSCRSRHTNLVNFVIFWSFLLPLFVFRLVSCSAYLIQLADLRLFQLIASKRANLLEVRISITRRFSVWHVAAYGCKIGPSWLGTQFSVSKSQ